MSASLNWIAWNFEIGLAELVPLLGVLEGLVVGAHRQADRERRDRDAAAVEDRQEILEPLAPLAEQVLLGDLASAKASSRVSDARQPILRYFFERVKPGVSCGTMIVEISLRPLRRACRSPR